MPELTPKIIDSLLQSYFARELEKFKDDLDIGITDHLFGYDLDDELAYAEAKLPELRKNLVVHKYTPDVIYDAEEMVKKAGFELPRKSSAQWSTVCHKVMRAKVELYRVFGALMRGEYDDINPKDPLFQSSVSSVMGQTTALQEGEPLGEIIKQFKDFKKTSWANKTLLDNTRVLKWLVEICGETLPVTSISKEHVAAYRDAMIVLPKNYSKSKEYKDKTLPEVIKAGGDYETVTGKTAHKYMGMLKSFFNWCVKEEYITAAPGAQISLPNISKGGTPRKPFNDDQLKAIFTSPIYCGCKSIGRRALPGDQVFRDGKFWVPLIGLFTGMRLGEVVQLRTADIRQREDHWYFDVTTMQDDEDELMDTDFAKQLKTVQSQRCIPVHSELIRMGFLDYLSARRKAKHGSKRLFHDINAGKDGYYSHNFSKMFSRYLTAIAVKTPAHVFHSFRHSFKGALDVAGVADSHKDALMGHIDMTQAKNTYSPLNENVKALAPDIVRVKFGLDLGHLYIDQGKKQTLT